MTPRTQPLAAAILALAAGAGAPRPVEAAPTTAPADANAAELHPRLPADANAAELHPRLPADANAAELHPRLPADANAAGAAGTAEAALAAPADANDAAPTTRPVGSVRPSMHKLWRESLRPPETAKSARLRRTIEELRGIEVFPLPRGKSPLAATADLDRPAATQPAATQPAATRPAATQPAGGPAEPTRTLPKDVVERLARSKAKDPAGAIRLADALYRTGYLSAAFGLYERAMAATDAAEPRAWALYQMANCRRTADPAAAEALYRRVAGEYPESAWGALSAIEGKLLAWRRVNRPEALLESIETVGPTTAPARGEPETAASRPAGAPEATTNR